MKVLTEVTLRAQFKNNIPEQYRINKKTIITPSARQFLQEKKVKLVYEEADEVISREVDTKDIDGNVYKPIESTDKRIVTKYIDYYTDGAFEEKPEYMTQLYGNKLVIKDDPRIIFRGRLDSLQSEILKTLVYVDSLDETELTQDLNNILLSTREILRAEVMEEPLKELEILGLNAKEIREMSHNPKKHFGINHIMPSYDMGKVIIDLNSLRSTSREVEISAIKAFKSGSVVNRPDILKALNRLSSIIYIVMCKYKAGLYK